MPTNDIEQILNKLNSRSLDVFEMAGLYSFMIFSKEIFKKNSDVVDFISYTVKINLPIYITKSRTLMVARTIKIITNGTDKEQKEICSLCIEYIMNSLEHPVIKKGFENNVKKRRNENDKMSTWLRGLKNDK